MATKSLVETYNELKTKAAEMARNHPQGRCTDAALMRDKAAAKLAIRQEQRKRNREGSDTRLDKKSAQIAYIDRLPEPVRPAVRKRLFDPKAHAEEVAERRKNGQAA